VESLDTKSPVQYNTGLSYLSLSFSPLHIAPPCLTILRGFGFPGLHSLAFCISAGFTLIFHLLQMSMMTYFAKALIIHASAVRIAVFQAMWAIMHNTTKGDGKLAGSWLGTSEFSPFSRTVSH